jgi:RNA polymerase I-specific transcription initiation factor RRN3
MMATAYSSLHTQKPPRRPTMKAKPVPPVQTPVATSAVPSLTPLDPLASSRTSSLAGRKRPRDSDGDAKLKPRRTKSAGDSSQAKNREAFQRGLIAVFVPNALTESTRGEVKSYNELLAYFLPAPLQPEPSLPAVLPLVRTIAANVNLLSPLYHSALVSAIINLPWATGDDRFVRVFVGWAGVLVSAHPDWANEVAIMAVKGLTWRMYHIPHCSVSHLMAEDP